MKRVLIPAVLMTLLIPPVWGDESPSKKESEASRLRRFLVSGVLPKEKVSSSAARGTGAPLKDGSTYFVSLRDGVAARVVSLEKSNVVAVSLDGKGNPDLVFFLARDPRRSHRDDFLTVLATLDRIANDPSLQVGTGWNRERIADALGDLFTQLTGSAMHRSSFRKDPLGFLRGHGLGELADLLDGFSRGGLLDVGDFAGRFQGLVNAALGGVDGLANYWKAQAVNPSSIRDPRGLAMDAWDSAIKIEAGAIAVVVGAVGYDVAKAGAATGNVPAFAAGVALVVVAAAIPVLVDEVLEPEPEKEEKKPEPPKSTPGGKTTPNPDDPRDDEAALATFHPLLQAVIRSMFPLPNLQDPKSRAMQPNPSAENGGGLSHPSGMTSIDRNAPYVQPNPAEEGRRGTHAGNAKRPQMNSKTPVINPGFGETP